MFRWIDDRLRDAYAALKIDLAARFQYNRVAYTDAKTDFIRRNEQ